MRRALVALLAIAACSRNQPNPGENTKPRLVVLIVIDQWPSWVFEQQAALFTGGIGRLLREGGVVMNAEIPYAGTFTAAGHATIGTGTTPNVHGVVANYWYRRDEERSRPAEYDPESPLLVVGDSLGGPAIEADDGASSKALRVSGVADALRAQTAGAARSVAIALKSRAACLVSGQKPDLAIWYEPGAGGMTTSKAFADEAPAWLVQLARDAPASRYFGSTWDPRDPALLARATKLGDEMPGERGEHGLDGSFPHSLAHSDAPHRAIMATPFADELVSQTVALALDAMQLGKDDVADLLAVSFGAHDYAGHAWGPDSWEVLDLTLRLDAALGQLFELLDARLGENRWAVVVTSDHGATPLVERARLRSARRISPREIEAAAERALQQQLGAPGPWVAKHVATSVYMTPKFRALSDDAKNTALEAAIRGVRAVPGIAYTGRTDRFSPGCTVEKDTYQAICRSTVPGESGELYAVATAGSVITEYRAGTGHDAPFDDNRRVPILVKAPGVAPQRGEGTLLQVAPTVAALLGIAPPEAARAAPLFGIERR